MSLPTDLKSNTSNRKMICHKYWKKRLNGLECIPYFENRIDNTEKAGRCTEILQGSQLTSDKLNDLAQSTNAQHIVLLSTFSILVWKLYGIADLGIVTSAPGENSEENEKRRFVFRSAVDPNLSFQEHLKRAKEAYINDLSYADFPLEKTYSLLSADSCIEAELSLNNGTNASKTTIEFDLNTKSGLSLKIIYDSSNYQKEYITAIGGSYLQLLHNLLDQKELTIEEIPVLSEANHNRIVHSWNATASPLGQDTILSLFEDQARRNPQEEALVFEERRVTYGELSRKANALAAIISDKYSPQQAERIGLIANNSVEMIVAIVATMKLGCAYVPLSSASPAERNRFILKDAEIAILLIQNEIADHPNVGPLREHITSCILDEAAWGEKHFAPIEICPDDTIYVIYTSGTEGKPKGVEITHKGVVNFIKWRISNYQFTKDDVTLQLLSFQFDGFGSNLFASLLSGGRLVLVSEENKLDGDQIIKAICTAGVTNAVLTPTLYDLVLDGMKDVPNSLRLIVLAGEKSNSELVRKSRKYLGNTIELSNEYGPTEASIGVAHYPQMSEANSSIIGRPIWNTKVYILGESNTVLPAGITGEICVSGAGLAKGYFNNPALTAEKFVPNPFEQGKTMYCTGDLARWTTGGDIDYIGRKDNQVKIRGYRVELSEIEAHLQAHDGIIDAVVLLDDHKIKAFYRAESKISADDLNEFFKHRLPEYMRPSSLLQVPDYPLTINSKIDKKALLTIQKEDEHSFVPPESSVEKQLAAIWADILHLESNKISVNQTFFELGGHSLSAAILVNHIQKKFEVNVQLGQIFEMSTIQKLAEFIENSLYLSQSQDDRSTRDQGITID
ncbi:non-ribosomal peptide synthetase [Fulvivirga sp.]|uniref:non-ribosomal peptide synthetase n=1 Tax=Fulvivirga sp. TaxID=1931237 RepID=UPI0032EF30F2